MDYIKIAEARASLAVRGNDKPDSGNELDSIDIPEFREQYKTPPGSMGEFMAEIEGHFENRHEGEIYRMPGAIGLVHAMAGRSIIGPSAKNKCATGTFIVGRSGAGKAAPIDFIKAYAEELGIGSRVSKSIVTSLKQIKERTIDADGSLLYIADDCPEHLQSWSDARSSLGETASWFRASVSGAWFPESTVVKDFQEKLLLSQNVRMITAASQAQGWIIPRLGDDGVIDYKRLANMPHDVGRRLKHAIKAFELSTNEKGVENIRFIPFITVTPEQGITTVRRWEKDGGMGRTMFFKGHDHMPELKTPPDKEVNRTIINEWKPRIPGGFFNVVYESDEVAKYYDFLRRRIDMASNMEGVVGSVGARSAQMVIEMATLCAFSDLSARDGMNKARMGKRHLEWSYSAVMNSLYSVKDYLEGESAFDGTEINEWEGIVAKVRKCMESKRFSDKPYISIIKNAVCRDRIKKIIAASDSNNLQMNADKFIYEVIVAISENRNSPIELNPDNPSIVQYTGGGSWSGLVMNSSVRNILTAAVKRMRFMRGI